MLCDLITGKFWSTDISDDKHRFLIFDPEFNKFERHEVSPPDNPYTHKLAPLRGYTDNPAMDGWYYCVSCNGTFFKFKPEGSGGPEVERLGISWNISVKQQHDNTTGMDVLQMVLSPNGRYVYYYPRGYPAPLVQYDVKTGKKKPFAGFMITTTKNTVTG